MFLLYVLIHCLCAKQPVALQLKRDFYFLFTEQDISEHSVNLDGPLWKLSKTGVIALSNLGDTVTIPAEAFLLYPRAYVVQATSPGGERWQRWHKQRGAEPYIMDIWTTAELIGLA